MAVKVLSTVVPRGHTRRLAKSAARADAPEARRALDPDPCAAPMIGKCGEQLAVHDLTAAAIG